MTLVLTYLPVLVLTLSGAVTISAQQAPLNRVVYVSVTDPLHRFVTGLDDKAFAVIEKGILRPITAFSDPDSPGSMAIAIISDGPLSEPDSAALVSAQARGLRVELIQAETLPLALLQLAASNNERKALITTGTVDTQQIPSNIQVFRAASGIWPQVLVELQNQYVLRFESPAASGTVDVVVNPQRGLPPLKATRK